MVKGDRKVPVVKRAEYWITGARHKDSNNITKNTRENKTIEIRKNISINREPSEKEHSPL